MSIVHKGLLGHVANSVDAIDTVHCAHTGSQGRGTLLAARLYLTGRTGLGLLHLCCNPLLIRDALCSHHEVDIGLLVGHRHAVLLSLQSLQSSLVHPIGLVWRD